MMSCALAGVFAGPALALPVSGWLAETVGWSAPYYLYGALGAAWYCLWLQLAFEKPSMHPSISENEKLYIGKYLQTGHSQYNKDIN